MQRFLLLSRIRDEETREQLDIEGSGWGDQGLWLFSEARAKAEYEWLAEKSMIREYLLFRVEYPTDTLDDDIPF